METEELDRDHGSAGTHGGKIVLNEVTKAQNNKGHMDPASNLVYNLKHRLEPNRRVQEDPHSGEGTD